MHCKVLEVLSVSCPNPDKSRLSDHGISLLGGCQSLKELSLSSREASCKSLVHVRLAHPSLTSLNLSECSKAESLTLETPLLRDLSLLGCRGLKAVTLVQHDPSLVIKAGQLKTALTSLLSSHNPPVSVR